MDGNQSGDSSNSSSSSRSSRSPSDPPSLTSSSMPTGLGRTHKDGSWLEKYLIESRPFAVIGKSP